MTCAFVYIMYVALTLMGVILQIKTIKDYINESFIFSRKTKRHKKNRDTEAICWLTSLVPWLIMRHVGLPLIINVDLGP